MIWLVLLVASFVLYWMYDSHSNRHKYRLSKALPGYKPWPIIGSAHLWALNTKVMFKFLVRTGELALQNDGVYTAWLGPHLLTFLTNVEDVETVVNKYLGKPFQYDLVSDLLGYGLLTLRDADEWKRRRKIIQPTFNLQILNSYIDKMNANSMKIVEMLELEVGKGKTDVLDLLGTSMLDNVIGTFMDSTPTDYIQEFGKSPTQLENLLSRILLHRTTRIWLWWDAIFLRTAQGKLYKRSLTALRDYTSKLLFKKRQAFTKKSNGGSLTKNVDSLSDLEKKYFLNSMILDKPQKLTDDEIIEEMRTISIAGFETTSIVVSTVLLLIGSHPEVQNKIYEELSSIYHGPNGPVGKEDLAQMTYLEYVIKETMRLYPPGLVFGRDITSDTKLRNCTLPGGSTAYILAYTIQRDKKIWGPDALEFKPERWMTEMTDKKHPCSYLPFSHGARNCIGLRYAMLVMKITLANILRNFKVIADISSAEFSFELVLKIVNGYNIEFVKRNH